MDLFGFDNTLNLLPYDGEVNYFGCIFDQYESDAYFQQLFESIEWRHDEVVILGKHITTQRKIAWYGDKNYNYTYSNTTKQALPWTTELLALKSIAEEKTKRTFNSCLLNLYHSGAEGVTWHSDNEKALAKEHGIASMSFGAERKFSFKHKRTKESLSIVLENGSLLIMKGATQKHWLHCLPKTTKVSEPRINLTFRTIVEEKRQDQF